MAADTIVNYKAYADNALEYNAYMDAFEKAVEVNSVLPQADQIPKFEYYTLNLQRARRIYKTYTLTPDVIAAINSITKPVHWLIITEPWCGDSSQILSVLQRIAEESEGKLQLHLLYRDQNPELIDQFLTNGSRSIPKLVQLNSNFELTGEWGARPAEAQALVNKLKAEGMAHDEFIVHLHKWYAADKAQALSKEMVELLGKANQ
jgi:thioredoxin-like negative regulator of GroEL